MPFSAFLALRFNQGKQSNHGFVRFFSKTSSIGIALGVSVLILALSVINGFEQQLKTRLLNVIPHIQYLAPSDPIQSWQDKVVTLSHHEQVTGAAPFIKASGMVQFKGKLKALELKGIAPKLESKVSDIGEYIKGKHYQQLNTNEVILGKQILISIGANIGDKVTLLLPAKADKDNQLAKPYRKRVTVVGEIEMGGPVDQITGLIQLNQLQTLFGYHESEVTGLQVKLKDVFKANQYGLEIGQLLSDYVYINTWFRSQGNLYQDIQMVRVIVFITVFLIIAVASFNIVSTLIMEVKEKQANIAILKTMGAQDSTIILSFLIQGVFQALVGVIFGVVIGLTFAYVITDIFNFLSALNGKNVLQGVYFIEFLPSKIESFDVVVTVVITLMIASLASIYPAIKASKINPAETLGH